MSEPNLHDAILLLAHGTPDVLGEMAEYLSKVTGGRALPQAVVEELQHRYAEIGLRDEPIPGGPPLTKWTLEQGRLLGETLEQRVYVGMRNWRPYIADTLAAMRADGVTRFKAICLAPQNSRTSTGLYRRATTTAAHGMEMEFVAGWSEHPLLALAFAEQLWPVWAEACAATGTRVPVLFTRFPAGRSCTEPAPLRRDVRPHLLRPTAFSSMTTAARPILIRSSASARRWPSPRRSASSA
jgi:ferrochelatase